MSFSEQALADYKQADPKLIDPAKDIYTSAHKVARAAAAFLGEQSEVNFLELQTAQKAQNQAFTRLDRGMCESLPENSAPKIA